MTTDKNQKAQAPISPAEYNELVDNAELTSVRLVSSNFKLEPDAIQADGEDMKRSYSCVTEGCYFEDGDDRAVGIIDASASLKVNKKNVFKLKCQYVVFYSVKGSPSKIAVQTFINRVGRFAVYPYFRGYFAEVCSQAGLYVPPLPIMREGQRPIPDVKPIQKILDKG
jgi:hypothetical protein